MKNRNLSTGAWPNAATIAMSHVVSKLTGMHPASVRLIAFNDGARGARPMSAHALARDIRDDAPHP